VVPGSEAPHRGQPAYTEINLYKVNLYKVNSINLSEVLRMIG